MTEHVETRAAVERWLEVVWKPRAWDRVPEFVGAQYVRHEPAGTRTVTPQEYATELAKSAVAQAAPRTWDFDADIFVDGDVAFVIWAAAMPSGEVSSVQAYRVAEGRLVETWYSALAPVRWPLMPTGAGDADANKRLLTRWYEEMYAQRRFAELAPQQCGPSFVRHEATGTFTATAEEHGQRIAEVVARLDAAGMGDRLTGDYRSFAAGDKVGVIAYRPQRRTALVQAWRVEDGKFVESWWAGSASDVVW